MYRAVCDFDGSDSLKCISLTTGDQLSAVHILDETWYVGFNERTKQTGAFPAACVDQEDGNDYTPLPIKSQSTDDLPEKAMYANVSKLIQDKERKKASTGAKPLNVNRHRSTKPEKSFTLKLVKSTSKDETPNNQSTTIKPDEVFVIPTRVTKDNTLQRVRFDDVKLEHSISVPDSVTSWQDSSFEDSFRDQLSNYDNYLNESAQKTTNKEKDTGKYHRFEKWNKFKLSTERLFESPKEEKRALKAIVGIVAGIIIGGLMFLIYHFSFGYTATQAGIISAVLTVLFCVGLALSSFVRCIIALVIPNFFTGIGRAILLSVIFALILQYPVSNISHNAKETGSSMACVLEQAANQTRILQRQLAVPLQDISEYIANQQRELKAINDKMKSVTAPITNLLKQLDVGASSIEDKINLIRKECRDKSVTVKSECDKLCNGAPFPVDKLCGEVGLCSSLQGLSSLCDGIHLDVSLVDIAEQARRDLDYAVNYFKADIRVTGEIEGSVNVSKPAVAIKNEINRDITEKLTTFGTIMSWLQKFLSLSLLMIFFKSFWYLRNYLAKDGYDNIYITKQFKELDKEAENHGREIVLPLKKKEIDQYVDARSFRLNRTELSYSKLGLVQVLLHLLLYIIVVAFDFALYHILNLIRRHGDIALEIESQNSLKISVEGAGPVADFYRIMVKSYNKDHVFNLTIDVKPCLPNATEPSASMIPVFLILYIIVFLVVILRAYGMRLRRKVSAYYCPEQELARLDYLHKKIRHKRVGFLNFIRQQIKSAHKEGKVKEKLRLSSWLTFNIPLLAHFLPKRTKLECTSCEQRENSFNDVKLSQCEGTVGGVRCDAVYCQECKIVLQNTCPLCSGDDVVQLRE